MPLPISTFAQEKKNTLNQSGAWLTLLSFEYYELPPVRVVANNTEQITWNGNIYYPVDIQLGDQPQTKEGELPEIDLQYVDLEGRFIPTIEQYDGATDCDVYIYLVHSENLSETTPERESHLIIISSAIIYNFIIKIKLGAPKLSLYRFPPDKYLKNHCRFKEFGGALCKYAGTETVCNRPLARCVELENESNFGGFPGIGSQGWTA